MRAWPPPDCSVPKVPARYGEARDGVRVDGALCVRETSAFGQPLTLLERLPSARGALRAPNRTSKEHATQTYTFIGMAAYLDDIDEHTARAKALSGGARRTERLEKGVAGRCHVRSKPRLEHVHLTLLSTTIWSVFGVRARGWPARPRSEGRAGHPAAAGTLKGGHFCESKTLEVVFRAESQVCAGRACARTICAWAERKGRFEFRCAREPGRAASRSFSAARDITRTAQKRP